jgi:hypothetical protein
MCASGALKPANLHTRGSSDARHRVYVERNVRFMRVTREELEQDECDRAFSSRE